MRIKLLTIYAGPGGTFQPGRELSHEELPNGLNEAQALVSGGYAVPMTDAVERAVTPPVEVRAEPAPEPETEAPTAGRTQPSRSGARRGR